MVVIEEPVREASDDSVRVPGPVTRMRRQHGLVRSSLRRRTDRIEAVVTAVLALLAVVTVPVAVTVGLGSYERGIAEVQATSAQRTKVSAVLVQDPVAPYAPFSDRGAPPPASAAARWQLPNGQPGSGTLRVSADRRAGDRIPIWVDQTGKQVDPPLTAGDVVVSAYVTGIDVILLGWLVLGFLWWAVCQVLRRLNAVQWELQWARTGPGWNHRTWQ
jgi:hypothetical protein